MATLNKTTTTNLYIICFKYSKYPFFNQATEKKILAKFSFPEKNPRIENFKPSKILRSSPVT